MRASLAKIVLTISGNPADRRVTDASDNKLSLHKIFKHKQQHIPQLSYKRANYTLEKMKRDVSKTRMHSKSIHLYQADHIMDTAQWTYWSQLVTTCYLAQVSGESSI